MSQHCQGEVILRYRQGAVWMRGNIFYFGINVDVVVGREAVGPAPLVDHFRIGKRKRWIWNYDQVGTMCVCIHGAAHADLVHPKTRSTRLAAPNLSMT